MNSKQFAWAYLIEHGIAGQEPSFYGGYDVVDKRLKDIKLKSSWDLSPYTEFYLKEIRQYGVNWERTNAPHSDMVSKFKGTFEDSTEKEYLFGELILNNGSKQTWVAEALEISNVFDMMERVSESENKFKEIFG